VHVQVVVLDREAISLVVCSDKLTGYQLAVTLAPELECLLASWSG